MSEDTFGASEEVPRTVELGDETIHTGIVPTTVIRSGDGRGNCHRRDGSAWRRCRRHGRVRGDQRPPSCGSPERPHREAACRSPERTSPAERPCCAVVSSSPAVIPACWPRSASRWSRSGESRSSPFSRPGTRSSLRASRCDRRESTTPTPRCSPMRCESSAASRCASGSPTTTWPPCENKLHARARELRRRHPLRRDEQGSGRPVVSRRCRTSRSRDRRARRRAQARQADLSGGDSRPSGGRAPGLSDVGRLHVSRVRRAGAAAARLVGAPRSEPSSRPDWRSRSTARLAARSTCWWGWSSRSRRGGGNISRRVSDGTGIRQRHDVQSRRRLRHDRPARRDRPGGHAGRRPAARPGPAAGRPRGDWQPLHRSGLSARRVGAAGRALQVPRCRQHRGAGRRQARRV